VLETYARREAVVIVAVTVADGRVGHGLGRAETVAVADVRDGKVQDWTEVDVHWGALHDIGSEGEHHARIVRFFREHHIERVVAGGAAALLGIVVTTVLFAAGVGVGSAIGGLASGDAMVGCAALGLYAAAIVGIGVAVGGLWRTSLAAEVASLAVVATYLLDLVAPPLKLPDWVHQLALTVHFGQPMVGEWDMVGVVASLAIAVGGILLGAWGMRRRDVD